MSFNVKKIIVLILSTIIASCSTTSLMDSWKDVELDRSYQHPMILAISDSQQTRQIYEKYFVAELKKVNITATPSYKLISSKQKINRETVVAAIQGKDIDSVLVTYLVSADTEVKHRESPLNTGYSAEVDSNQISATIVSNRGQSRDEEVFVLKNDIYDAESKTLVWSARTKTVGPESVDQVVKEVTALLIKEMLSDGIIK
jgi:hypothetical protein